MVPCDTGRLLYHAKFHAASHKERPGNMLGVNKEPSAPASKDRSFSSGATLKAVQDAAAFFAANLTDEELDAQFAELNQDAGKLADAERNQLLEIAQLQTLAASAGLDTGAGVVLPASISVAVSDDLTKAFLTIQPALNGGPDASPKDVSKALADKNIKKGVDPRAIAKAIMEASAGQPVYNHVIATGRLPQQGKAAKVTRFARLEMESPPCELTDVHLKQQTMHPLMCCKGDVLLSYEPAVAGVDGYTVTGKVLPPDPIDMFKPVAGSLTRLDGTSCIAEQDGVVRFADATIEVRRCMVIPGDLTSATGPIEYNGEVHVQGNVREGASIIAEGRIHVYGVVEAASLTSTTSDVVLKQGVVGRGKAMIRAGRDIVAKYSENANLFATRDLTLHVGAMHCNLTAGRAIRIDRGKGNLTGGMAVADQLIIVRNLGSKANTITRLAVGISAEAIIEMDHIDKQTIELKHQLAPCVEAIEKIERAVRDPSKLKNEELAAYTRLCKVRLILDHKVRGLQAQRDRVIEEASLDHRGKVQITSGVVGVTEVSFGKFTRKLDPIPRATTITFHEESNQIIVN